MFFASTVNGDYATTDEVLTLCYEGKRKLVLVPENFEQLVYLVKRKFGLEGDFSLQTSTLDGCQGENCEIDEDVWDAVCTALSVVHITPVDNAGRAATVAPGGAPPTPESIVQDDDEGEKEAEEEEEEEVPRQETPYEEREEPEDEEEIVVPPKTPVAGPSRRRRIVVDSDSENDGNYPTASTSNVDATKPLESEHSHGKAVEPEVPPPPPSYTSEAAYGEPDEEEESAFDEVHGLTSSVKQEPVSHSAGLQVNSTVKKEVKHEPASPALDAGPSQSSSQPPESQPSQSQSQSDDVRYEVVISHPSTGQESKFRMRGRHTIRKVLSGVCKSFDLDPDSAKLMLLVEEGFETHQFPCDPNDTMTITGVKDGSKFIVVTDED